MRDPIGDGEASSKQPDTAPSHLRVQSAPGAVGDELRRLGGVYENRELEKLVELSVGKDQIVKGYITGPRRLFVVTSGALLSFSYTGEPPGPIKWAKNQLTLTWSEVQGISTDPAYPERIRVELRGEKPPHTISVDAGRRDQVITVLKRARDDATAHGPHRDVRQSLIACPDCGRRISWRASTCPQCGAPIRVSRRLSAPEAAVERLPAKSADDPGATATRTRKSPFACPICNDDRRCRKVSAVYHSQTSTHTRQSSGSVFTPFIAVLFGQRFRLSRTSSLSRGTERSNLAKLLAPPRHRATYASTRWPMRLLMLLIGMLANVTLAVMVLDKVPPYVDTALFWIGLPAVPLLLIVFVPRLFGAPTKGQYNERLARWESTYYCSKHDVAFVPGTDTPLAARDFQKFLKA